MSQAPFPSASLLTEGLIEERLRTRQISKAATEAVNGQYNLQPRDLAVDIESNLAGSQTEEKEVIVIKETPHADLDTRHDDTGPVPLDISSEMKLPQPPESTDSGTPKAIEIPHKTQSDEWTTAVTDGTDDETLNWLEQELAKQNLVKDSSTSKGANVQEHEHATWPLSTRTKRGPPPKLICSESDHIVIIHRGFGNFVVPQSVETRTSFPPLSNASYDLTTYGLDPKAVKNPPKRVVVNEDNAPVAKKAFKGLYGELRTLNGNLSDTSSVPSNGTATLSVVSIDNLEFCTKCQKRHIKQGPPITLDDRDTCRSMLPAWFPKERYEKPWETFTDLMNGYVRASQILNGTEENPETKAPWSKEYHDPSPEWKEAGRFGGWWKCRIEDDNGDSDVPSVEKNCRICLKRKIQNGKLPAKKVETLLEKKQSIEDWIDKHMKQEMVKDSAYVKARLETEGF
ncbi:hypothetical protein V493_04539 [Pseudogymnoascus sp. VKM F-4281 (FW-2241)]|nr:hypothetical protein V493_04539 [Pseudogymnoascus sp. VKM F-4281 (FW-2241)]